MHSQKPHIDCLLIARKPANLVPTPSSRHRLLAARHAGAARIVGYAGAGQTWVCSTASSKFLESRSRDSRVLPRWPKNFWQRRTWVSFLSGSKLALLYLIFAKPRSPETFPRQSNESPPRCESTLHAVLGIKWCRGAQARNLFLSSLDLSADPADTAGDLKKQL